MYHHNESLDKLKLGEKPIIHNNTYTLLQTRAAV